MIPVKLALRNFMCYRDNVPALHFDGIHVACLCGDNGSGKSTIFDAMTWALWGKCRASTIDELISAGQNEMEVELEFVSAGRHFRVIRKYARSSSQKTAKSMLDLHVFDGAGYRSISEQGILETERKIVNLLHLDYETFINSALLLQGRANEFSKKKPGERKEILASILDLDFYTEMERQARALAERKKGEEENLARDIAAIIEKTAEKPGLEAESARVHSELLSLRKAATDNEAALLDLRRQKEALTARQETLNQYKQQLTVRNTELQNQKLQLAALDKDIELYGRVIADKVTIEEGFAGLKASAARIEHYNEMLAKSSDIKSRKFKLQEIVNSALNVLNTEKRMLSQQAKDLQSRADGLPGLEAKLASLQARLPAMESQDTEIELQRRLYTEKSTLTGSLSASLAELSHAVQDINARLEMISHAGAACPLCESELGPEGHITIEKKLKDELAHKVALQNENNARSTQLRKELAELDKLLKQKEPAFKSARDTLNQQITLTEREIKEAQTAAAELPAKFSRLQQIDADLRDRRYAADQQAALRQLESEEAALGYDPTAHEAEKQSRVALLKFEDLQAKLSQAELKLGAQQTTRDNTLQEIARLETILGNAQGESVRLEKELLALPGVLKQLVELDARRITLQKQERESADALATLQEKIRQIDQLHDNKLEKEAQAGQLKEDNSLYTELAAAFSKKGIQAVLIADSIPEIEREANLLLGKMTDNRMSLAIETQRGNKKGDMVETLEIKIADELGTRNYEMFSGGEAFRIDLSLRIAISRLLVRRAGASLPLLVIDEGFGTQDSAGLEKLVEAINSIQDDFEKIFIITHLEELKDKFPVLINVTKTAGGSTITLSQ